MSGSVCPCRCCPHANESSHLRILVVWDEHRRFVLSIAKCVSMTQLPIKIIAKAHIMYHTGVNIMLDRVCLAYSNHNPSFDAAADLDITSSGSRVEEYLRDFDHVLVKVSKDNNDRDDHHNDLVVESSNGRGKKRKYLPVAQKQPHLISPKGPSGGGNGRLNKLKSRKMEVTDASDSARSSASSAENSEVGARDDVDIDQEQEVEDDGDNLVASDPVVSNAPNGAVIVRASDSEHDEDEERSHGEIPPHIAAARKLRLPRGRPPLRVARAASSSPVSKRTVSNGAGGSGTVIKAARKRKEPPAPESSATSSSYSLRSSGKRNETRAKPVDRVSELVLSRLSEDQRAKYKEKSFF
eukprot:TRINITY_DN79456_c0_g1_i1.p1 TRINITY_DN79456_c0_g1~~TRINITY_DN79456_c0_g1_i1.p1  ORF type:complete len:354 (+),score=84.77 TRINITY_DN79456_c0_g1_i1:25-1086(+)